MPAFEHLPGTLIAARSTALDSLEWPTGTIVLRLAADECFVMPPQAEMAQLLAADEHAIVMTDSAFSGAWIEEATALNLLERHCEWEAPRQRPAFAQGAVAGIPTKLWFTVGHVLFLVPTPYAQEMEERLV